MRAYWKCVSSSVSAVRECLLRALLLSHIQQALKMESRAPLALQHCLQPFCRFHPASYGVAHHDMISHITTFYFLVFLGMSDPDGF